MGVKRNTMGFVVKCHWEAFVYLKMQIKVKGRQIFRFGYKVHGVKDEVRVDVPGQVIRYFHINVVLIIF